MVPYRDSEILTEDDRTEYEIIDNYYDLQELLEEVLSMYPKLTTKGLVKIEWSKGVVKKWFGQDHKLPYTDDGTVYHVLRINKLLSSPRIEKEVVKYLIFHELLHLNGYGWFNNAVHHDIEFQKREFQYPDSARLDSIIDSLQNTYNLEEIYSGASADEELDIEKYKELVFGEDSNQEHEQNKDSAKKELEYKHDAAGVKPGFIYCMNCGFMLPQTAKYCKMCGRKIE